MKSKVPPAGFTCCRSKLLAV